MSNEPDPIPSTPLTLGDFLQWAQEHEKKLFVIARLLNHLAKTIEKTQPDAASRIVTV